MLNSSRRTFIKSAAYTSALAMTGVAGFSSYAIAGDVNATQKQSSTENIDLINHTSSYVTIDSRDGLSIGPGEQLSFAVPAISNQKNNSANNKHLFITDELANNHVTIKSDYTEFNGIFALTAFTTLVS
ncbi:MAG: hypothetical protein ACI88H_002881 [Cocleimonas sp.]|jgi:hypothetical protein